MLTIFLIAIAVSMDAFSLSLLYGTFKISKKRVLLLSLLVGVFHFIMPLMGSIIGLIVIKKITVHIKFISSLLLLIVATDMLFSLKKDKDSNLDTSLFGLILFAISVSLDSFTIGTSLFLINNNYILIAIVFFIVTGLFTYGGLIIGKKIETKINKTPTIVGAIILIIISVFHFLF